MQICALCIYMHEPKFSDSHYRGNQRYEPRRRLFKILKNLIQMMCGYHELSQYFANVSCFALILWWKCCMGGSGTLVGPIGIRNQGSASKKNSLAIVSLSQWQHLSRHSHSQCSAWRSWILQSENSRLQTRISGYMLDLYFSVKLKKNLEWLWVWSSEQ